MAKGRGKQRGRGKKGKDKKDKKLSKREDTELERARANAALWEARLEISEISRDGYREAVRRLAQCNEDLKRQQYKMEKDAMAVLSYIKRQDSEKDLLIERLKQQVLDAKDKSEIDKEILQERYAVKINELEGQYSQKTKEIGLIQIELKTIKQFQRRKSQIERELEELRDTLRNSEKKHQDTLRRLEGRFFEEKCRLEKEAEKKVVMLAERAHQEAVVTNIKKGMDVDIGDLTWEQKEKVLRLLFAKMNGCPPRKHTPSSVPPVPAYVTLTTRNKDTFREDGNVQDQTFITQQALLTESSGLVLPDIQKGPDHSVS